MGKKGAKGKGKPVLMTQAEFFQLQSGAGLNSAQKDDVIKSEWEKANFFADQGAPKAKIVYAREIETSSKPVKQQEAAIISKPQVTPVEPTPPVKKADVQDDWNDTTNKKKKHEDIKNEQAGYKTQVKQNTQSVQPEKK